tara:strand:- start:9038 stop:10039 length:1002 start_codon:yes stop_codon:yes gene_type:complete
MNSQQKNTYKTELTNFTDETSINSYYNYNKIIQDIKKDKIKTIRDIDERTKIHIDLLLNEFMNNQYHYLEGNMRGFTKSKLKKTICISDNEDKNKSHMFREFKLYCDAKKYQVHNHLLINGEDLSGSEKVAMRTLKAKLLDQETEMSLLKRQMKEIVALALVVAENSNEKEVKKEVQAREKEVKMIIIEEEEEEEEEDSNIHFVDLELGDDPHDSDSDSDSDSESEEEEEDSEDMYEHPGIYPINWEVVEGEELDRLLRDESNKYNKFLISTYESQVNRKGGYDSASHDEIRVWFEMWFDTQISQINNKELGKYKDKFCNDLEKSLECIYTLP